MRLTRISKFVVATTLILSAVASPTYASSLIDENLPLNGSRPCTPMNNTTIMGNNTQISSIDLTETDGAHVLCGAGSRIPGRFFVRGSSTRINTSLFTVKKGNAFYEPRGQAWRIEKDHSGHGGSVWKLYNNQGHRIASLASNGYIMRMD